MKDLVFKEHDEIVEGLLVEFANSLGVESISNASDIAIKAKVYANKIEGIYYNQEFILKQSNPTTATDKYLDNWGKTLNNTPRKAATYSVGNLTFSRDYPAENDILIQEGIIVSTSEEIYGSIVNAITIEKSILKKGQKSVTSKAKSIEKGSHTNIPVGGFSIINNPPAGISYVKNNVAFSDGSDEETDEDYRSRFKKEKFYGTNDAFSKRAKEVDGVVYARTLELNRGPGTADVLIASENGIPSDELVDKVKKHILEKRPICSDLDVIKPISQVIDVSLLVGLKNGYSLESIVDGVLVIERIKAAIRKYLKDVGIGQTIRVMGIANEVYDLEEIIDVNVIIPTINIQLNENAIAIEGDINVEKI